MSYQEDPARQLSINVAVAINATAQLASRYSDGDPVQYFCDNLSTVTEAVLYEHAAQQAKADLGATESPVAAPLASVTPIGTPAAQFAMEANGPTLQPNPYPLVPQGPAAIPGVSDGDPQVAAIWTQFFQAAANRQVARDFRDARNGQWFDNRAGKTGRSPDFKIKGNKGEMTPGLWVQDKQNPSWVNAALTQAGF